MSNERFDKLMKKNLESVRPAYQPSTWNRFQKRLPIIGFWPWLLHNSGWVLSGLMLMGWLTTLYTLHENQQVMTQLLHTRTTTHSVGKDPALTSVPAQPSTHRVDTVYIIKRTIVEHRHHYYPTDQRPDQVSQNAEQIQLTDSLAGVINIPKMRLTDRIIRKQSYTAPGQRWPKNSLLNTAPSLRKQGKESLTPTLPTLVLDRTGKKNLLPESTNPDGILAKSVRPTTLADSMNRSIAAAIATIPADLIKLAVRAETSTETRLDSVARSAMTPPKAVSSAAAQLAKQSHPPFRLSSLQPRIGVETMVTLNGIGVGPTLELFPTENMGLSIGIQASQQQAENHQELKGFNSATGTEFIEQYKSYLPAKYDQIKDISVQTTLVRLPINLKYYVPLHRNWALLFQTGTSLDLAAYQQVSYESTYQGEEQFHSFEVNAQPRLFHNFMFGAGVQYRLPRILIQLSPYYLYDFRSLVNTPAGSDVGIKASVWLNLFK